MTFDPTINLSTLLSIGSFLLSAGVIYGGFKAKFKMLFNEVALIRNELMQLKEAIGCTDDGVAGLGEKAGKFSERLAAAERDILWLKGKKAHS